MTEDHIQRPLRSHETIARAGHPRTTSGSDPLAELARLIGQSDPFGDAMHASARLAESAGAPPAVDWTAATTHSTNSSQSFAPDAHSFQPPAAEVTPHEYVASEQDYSAADPQMDEVQRLQQQVPTYLTARAPAVEHVGYTPAHEQRASQQQDFYDDVPPRGGRVRVLAVAIVFALAVVGTAGAFGYRTLFGGAGAHVPPVIQADKSPLKVVPENAKAEGKKAIADRVTDTSEKLLPREEKPVDIAQKIAETAPPPPQPAVQPNAPPVAATGNGVIGSEPKKVHTIVIRPDGAEAPQAMPAPAPVTAAAPPAPAPAPAPAATAAASPPSPPPAASAAPAKLPAPAPKPAVAESKPKPAQSAQPAPAPRTASHAPLSLNPNAEPARAAPARSSAAEAAPRAPVRTASAGPSALAAAPAETSAKPGGYAVQVSSQKSEAEAKAAFHGLQGKYPQQLGSKPMFVHRVDLGAKGIYYRTMVGPFASAAEASELCSGLKSAGGSCIVQKN